MIKHIERIVILTIAVGSSCFVLIKNVNVNQNPQEMVANSEIFIEEGTEKSEQELTLAKYAFMTNAKKHAEQEYKQTLASEIDTKLQEVEIASDEYAKERDEIVIRKAELDKIKMQKSEYAADESLDDLMLALEQLQSITAQLTIKPNDVQIVTTGITPVTGEALIAGDRIDEDYAGTVLSISGENRDNLERLVMGEAGNQGFIGAALVAQTIHDTMIHDGCYDVLTIKQTHGYSGELYYEPNENVKRAVALIFDKGGIAVQHRLLYFYAPAVVSSDFHERMQYVVSYGEHKFFDNWE